MALAGRPNVLMLDEPTQGMSHGDTEDTAALIRSLAAEVTVLLIEHDIGLVMNLSDHGTAALLDGRDCFLQATANCAKELRNLTR